MTGPLRLGVVTDVHVGPRASHLGKLRKLSDQAEALLEPIIDDFNGAAGAQPVDVVLNLGDAIQDATLEDDRRHYGRFARSIHRASAPVLHVAGNHDLVNLTEGDLVGFWRQQRAALDLPALHYTLVVGSVRFVVLRSTMDATCWLGEAQLRFLASTLEAATEPVIVLVHHPLADMDLQGNRWFEAEPELCHVTDRVAARRLIAASGKVRAVVNGHVHWNHLAVHDGIPYLTVQSLIENLDDDAPGRPARSHAVLEVKEHTVAVHLRGEHEQRFQFFRP